MADFYILFIAGMAINLIGVVFAGSFSYAIPFLMNIFPGLNFGKVLGNLKVGSFARSTASTFATLKSIDFKKSTRIAAPIVIGAVMGTSFISNLDKNWLFPVFLFSIVVGIYVNNMKEKKDDRLLTILVKNKQIVLFLLGIFAGIYALLGFFVAAIVQAENGKDYGQVTIQTRFIEWLILPIVLITHFFHGNIIWTIALPWALGSIIGGFSGGILLKKIQKWTEKSRKNSDIFATAQMLVALIGKILALSYLSAMTENIIAMVLAIVLIIYLILKSWGSFKR